MKFDKKSDQRLRLYGGVEEPVTFFTDDGDAVRVEYRHGHYRFFGLRESGRHPPDARSGEMTLSGTVSKGMSITNIAGNRELEIRFTSRAKKLSTGLFR